MIFTRSRLPLTLATLSLLLSFGTGCAALSKAQGAATAAGSPDATKVAKDQLPPGVGDAALSAANGKVPDVGTMATAANSLTGNHVPGAGAIASSLASGKAPDVGTVANVANAVTGDKIPGAKALAAAADGKVPGTGALVAAGGDALGKKASDAAKAAGPQPKTGPSAPPPASAPASPQSTVNAVNAPSTSSGAGAMDIASYLGTAADGWAPRALAPLHRGMRPQAVAGMFPGADDVQAGGFSEVSVSDGHLVGRYRFFFEAKPNGTRGLRDVTLYFDKNHKSAGFYKELVSASERKFGPADKADVRRGSVLWVGADDAIAQMSRDKQGECSLQVDFAR